MKFEPLISNDAFKRKTKRLSYAVCAWGFGKNLSYLSFPRALSRDCNGFYRSHHTEAIMELSNMNDVGVGCSLLSSSNVSNTGHTETSPAAHTNEPFFTGDIGELLPIPQVELEKRKEYVCLETSNQNSIGPSQAMANSVLNGQSEMNHGAKCENNTDAKEECAPPSAEALEKDLLELLSSPIGVQNENPLDIFLPTQREDGTTAQVGNNSGEGLRPQRLSSSDPDLSIPGETFAVSPLYTETEPSLYHGQLKGQETPRTLQSQQDIFPHHVKTPTAVNGTDVLSDVRRDAMSQKGNHYDPLHKIPSIEQGFEKLNSYDKRLREKSLAIFSATEEQKMRPMKKSRTYSKAVPSRFCHICTRQSKKSSPHAFCHNINRGTCRKAVCAKCFAKFGWDWKAVSSPGSQWLCPHCCNICPKGAQCYNYVGFPFACARTRQHANIKRKDQTNDRTKFRIYTILCTHRKRPTIID